MEMNVFRVFDKEDGAGIAGEIMARKRIVGIFFFNVAIGAIMSMIAE